MEKQSSACSFYPLFVIIVSSLFFFPLSLSAIARFRSCCHFEAEETAAPRKPGKTRTAKSYFPEKFYL
jgi:hypothetical protein